MLRPETFVRQRCEALFAEQRPRLMGIAYRMLGTTSDADQVLDAALRHWSAGDVGEAPDPRTALTTVVTRLALQRLEHLRPERQGYAGAWLPEPVAGSGGGLAVLDPGAEGSLALELLAALETLSPLERAAYVLRVCLAFPYPEVAAALGRREPAVRQLVHRARTHLLDADLRLGTDPCRHEVVVRRLAATCRSASLPGLARLLAPDVVLRTDDHRATGTAPRRVVGRDLTARSILGVLRRLPAGAVTGVDSFNGTTGVVVRANGEPACALAVQVRADIVTSIQLVATPTKLHALRSGTRPTAFV